MATGTLKMWNADRGYGFIADDSGGPDIFLHISALQSAGIDPDNIRKGERLTFDLESTRDGRERARNVGRSGRKRKRNRNGSEAQRAVLLERKSTANSNGRWSGDLGRGCCSDWSSCR